MSSSRIPVVDLFAGPGGLGEGFASVTDGAGSPVFHVGLSIEMDRDAHTTLELRKFFRQFPKGQTPPEYYEHLRGTLSREALFKAYPTQAKRARATAWHAELGKVPGNELHRRIRDEVGSNRDWVLCGGPPCQAYSVVGRSRSGGIDPSDKRLYLYREYLEILAEHEPSVFIMENVKGLLSSTVKGNGLFARLLADLHAPGASVGKRVHGAQYHVLSLVQSPHQVDLGGNPCFDPQDFVIRSEAFGIPQSRHRVILLGVREDLAHREVPPLTPAAQEIPISLVLQGLPKLRSGLSRSTDTPQAWEATLQEVISSGILRTLPNSHHTTVRRAALGRHLGQAEIVFEYRSTEIPGPAADRREFRRGFLPVLDEIWQAANLRNDLQHFQHGLFVWDVPTFDERAVREAVLNAVSHRNYRHSGSVFVRQYPRRIEIVSPGGFPAGINQENLLWEQNPRNRRVAEVLARCGLVERAGQGFDLIYRECIRHGKPLPDFTRTSEHSVWVTLHGEIQDPEFLRFLEEIGRERAASFTTEDFLVIDLIHREQPVPAYLAPRLQILRDQGVIERIGQGRGARHLLSQRFYRFIGKGGAYTRRRGLDRETNKTLLLRHIEDSASTGTTLGELQQVLPNLSRDQVQTLLRELKEADKIQVQGITRAARWFPVSLKRNPTQ